MGREAFANSDSPTFRLHEDKVSGGTFVFPIRVFYEDTDAAGIVYYANYLKFMERARTEMLRCAGLNHTNIFSEYKRYFVVRRCLLDYLAVARLDDLLEIHTKVLCVKGASLNIEQKIFLREKKIVEAGLILACVGELGTPKRFPRVLRATLDALLT